MALIDGVFFQGDEPLQPMPRLMLRSGNGAMNHSMYSADHRTHLKIVVVGLLCATMVAFVGLFAHIGNLDLGTAPLVKAGQPTAVSGNLPPIR